MLGFESLAETGLADIAAIFVPPIVIVQPKPQAAVMAGAEWQYYDHLEYPYLSHPLIRIKRYG